MFTELLNGEWTLLNEYGGEALSFTSFIDISYSNEGQTLSYPIEQGGFIHYNKTQSPLSIKVTLGAQGSEADFEYLLSKLDEYKRLAVKLAVSTPAELYPDMTLASFSYERNSDGGAGMLTVSLNLVEVREVSNTTGLSAITRPKNPTSSQRVDTGLAQARNIKSVADITRAVFN